jgi:hypothetical protein
VYRLHDETLRTHYAELKERVRAAGQLLPGTPGSIVTHKVKGGSYISRAYYVASSRRLEDYIGAEDNDELRNAIVERMQFSEWTQERVGQLRKLGFQVADRETARVLVQLHNLGAFEAGLVLVGTLAYMARLNDLGVAVSSSRTRDIDVARESHIKLAIQLEFLRELKATSLPFVEVPGLSPKTPSTSAKLPGAGALRIDVLTSGSHLGAPVSIPELSWHAQAIPFYDFLLEDAEPSALLAGGHCIPVRIPQTGRFIWHKLYSSRTRRGEPEKARKDYQQAMTLAGALGGDAATELKAAFMAVPIALRKKLNPALLGFSREFKTSLPEVHDSIEALRK